MDQRPAELSYLVSLRDYFRDVPIETNDQWGGFPWTAEQLLDIYYELCDAGEIVWNLYTSLPLRAKVTSGE